MQGFHIKQPRVKIIVNHTFCQNGDTSSVIVAVVDGTNVIGDETSMVEGIYLQLVGGYCQFEGEVVVARETKSVHEQKHTKNNKTQARR